MTERFCHSHYSDMRFLNRDQPTIPTGAFRPRIRSQALRVAGGLTIGLSMLCLAWPAAAQIPLVIPDDDIRVRGNRQAPLTLLEYSDFTCGFCEKFFRETWPMLFSEYIQTGKLRLVYRDFPRAPSGPSVETAQAARCAGEQGQYWAMHDRLFASRDKFSPAQLRQQADTLQLDVRRFTACLEEAGDTEDIFADRMEANDLGFRGTPGFVLYVTDNPQEAVAIPGAFPYETFKETIDMLLNPAASPSPSSDPVSESSVSDQSPEQPRA